jgi:predicted DNA-binding transcriptional regulator AlpA
VTERVDTRAPEPLAVGAEAAGAISGLGKTKFLELVDEDRAPRPIAFGRRKVWAVDMLRRWIEDEAERADRFRKRSQRGTP